MNQVKNGNMNNIIIIADIDLSKIGGDVVRIMAFALYLSKKGIRITLIVPKPNNKNLIFNCSNIDIINI